MKMYLISDNVDSLMGFRLVGVEGEIVHDVKALNASLERVMQDTDVSVVLLTSVVFDLERDALQKLKLTLSKPLLVEISDRHRSHEVQAMLDQTIAKIIGEAVE